MGVLIEPDPQEELSRSCMRSTPRNDSGPGRRQATKQNIFRQREISRDLPLLMHDCNSQTCSLDRTRAFKCCAVDHDLAVIRSYSSRDCLDERGFTGPVLPD